MIICALCKKELPFLMFWQPKNFFPLDEKRVLCGFCREKLVASLPKKNNNVCKMNEEECSCVVCRNNFVSTRKKTGGLWLVKIGDYYICENCLRGEIKTTKAAEEKMLGNLSAS